MPQDKTKTYEGSESLVFLTVPSQDSKESEIDFMRKKWYFFNNTNQYPEGTVYGNLNMTLKRAFHKARPVKTCIFRMH